MTEIDEFSVDDEEDDFLLADFDISADDDELKEKAVELSTPDQTEQAAAVANPEVVPERVDAAVIPSSSNSVMTNDQSERIAQISCEHLNYKGSYAGSCEHLIYKGRDAGSCEPASLPL
jgi:hypothetical protein